MQVHKEIGKSGASRRDVASAAKDSEVISAGAQFGRQGNTTEEQWETWPSVCRKMMCTTQLMLD